jgi:alpha-glucosidase
VPSENTQYGLKNYLKACDMKIKANNHFQIELKGKKKNLFLNIVFFNQDTIRFHYRFEKEFSILNPNPELEFKIENMNFETDETDDEINIKTKKLKVIINKDPLEIEILNNKNELITADFPGLGFWSGELNNESTEVRCYRAYQDIENPPIIYGLGDKTGELNRWGKRFRNTPIDALGYDSKNTDPLYKDIPFFIELNRKTQNAHGIFFDNLYKKSFDFGREKKPGLYYYFQAEAGELNYYFFNGPSIKDVVQNYLNLTGMPALMPDHAFGYLASGMSYLENYGDLEDQDQRVINTLKRFKDERISATAFHMSSGYILNEKNERHQFIWNKEKFPEPKKFTDAVKDLGVELCANVKPVLLKTHPWYFEANEKDIFIKNEMGESLVVDYWGGEGSYIDFRKKQAQDWWSEKLENYIFAHGINGIWNDNNEYEIFEKHSAQDSEPLMANLMTKLSYQLAKKLNTEKEPWILSRSGYSGIQKYAQTWIGDNFSSWQSLKYDNTILSSMSLSGLVHCGTDIGGFYGPEVDAELFLRWIQCGVFTPRFSIHSYKKEATEPDMFKDEYKEYYEVIQNFFKIREELLPYLKEQNEKAHSLGIPIMRPLVYDFQDDENVHEESFNFMLGDKYLICPVTDKSSQKEIYLPGKDIKWQHYFTKDVYDAGQSFNFKNSFEYIHVFERA